MTLLAYGKNSVEIYAFTTHWKIPILALHRTHILNNFQPKQAGSILLIYVTQMLIMS